jgi:hydrogenase nickel incorporation protein HypA/HybF
MHELSIAHNIVEVATKAAEQAHASSVRTVHLNLGLFAGVMKESLLFGYDVATEGTLLEGSTLEIMDIPLVVHCGACNHETTYTAQRSFRCEKCGELTGDIRQGKELEIAYLEVETP